MLNIGEPIDAIIIDDDPDVVDVLTTYVEDMGYFRNIITAADGSVASAKLKNQKFSCIILDINMPKKSGTDLIHEISHKDALNSIDTVLVVSGILDKETLDGFIAKGVRHFLVKPFDPEALEEKVTKLIEKVAPDAIEFKKKFGLSFD